MVLLLQSQPCPQQSPEHIHPSPQPRGYSARSSFRVKPGVCVKTAEVSTATHVRALAAEEYYEQNVLLL